MPDVSKLRIDKHQTHSNVAADHSYANFEANQMFSRSALMRYPAVTNNTMTDATTRPSSVMSPCGSKR